MLESKSQKWVMVTVAIVVVLVGAAFAVDRACLEFAPPDRQPGDFGPRRDEAEQYHLPVAGMDPGRDGGPAVVRLYVDRNEIERMGDDAWVGAVVTAVQTAWNDSAIPGPRRVEFRGRVVDPLLLAQVDAAKKRLDAAGYIVTGVIIAD